jgi:hypothetical protein
VQVGYSEVSETSNAMRSALCTLRLQSQIEKPVTRNPHLAPRNTQHVFIITFRILFINYFKNLKAKKEKKAKVPKISSDKEGVRQNTGPERRRIKFVGSFACPAKIVENIFLTIGKNAKIKT